MIPANCMLAVCPHCGKKKEIIQLMSGNTLAATMWSDARNEYPMMPEASPVQKCPHCGKFFVLGDVDVEDGDNVSFEQGWLSFDDAVDAYHELYDKKDGRDRYELFMLMIIWGYNDMYRKGKCPTEEQYGVFKEIVAQLLEKRTFSRNTLLRAELYRETGMFDECLRELDGYSSNDNYCNKVCRQITAKAKEGDFKVFKLKQN